MPSESSILLGTSAANIESSAPNLLRTPGSIGSSSSMDGNDCNFVSLEEGAATTTSLSSSSSQSSSTNDVNNNEDDDENHGSILVEVEAPATLAEGYVFWATTTRSNDMDDNTHSCDNNDIPLISTNCIKSITFPVRVPPGGVSVGETLRVPILTPRSEEYSSSDTEDGDSHGSLKGDTTNARVVFRERNIIEEEPQPPKSSTAISSGQWKDGLYSCFRLGFFHPHLWNAWLCPQMLLGQILVRTNLTWMAHHLTDPNSHTTTASSENENKSRHNNCGNHSKSSTSPFRSTFRILVFLVVAGNLYDILSTPYTSTSTSTTRNDYFWWHQLFYFGLTLPMSVWGLVVVVRLRRTIRKRYDIQPTRVYVSMPSSSPLCSVSLGNSEDLFCGLCCGCCVISQVARQTADYEGTEVASCYGANGLRNNSIISANTEAPSTTPQNGNDVSGNRNKFFWWFRRLIRQSSPRSKQESTMTIPPSPSQSLESGSSAHLRYRLLSPSPSSSSRSSRAARESISLSHSPRGMLIGERSTHNTTTAAKTAKAECGSD